MPFTTVGEESAFAAALHSTAPVRAFSAYTVPTSVTPAEINHSIRCHGRMNIRSHRDVPTFKDSDSIAGRRMLSVEFHGPWINSPRIMSDGL